MSHVTAEGKKVERDQVREVDTTPQRNNGHSLVGSRNLSRREFLTRTALVSAAVTLGSLYGNRRRALLSEAEAALEADALTKFRSALQGRLIVPEDPLYDIARKVASFNPLTDKRPALVVQVATTTDVVRAVEFARTHGLEVAVRGGGHDVLGKSVCEGGMVIDLSAMKRTEPDPSKRLVRAQAGLRSGELNAATHPSGFVVPLGCNPVVGIAGLTLGGGVGWLAGTCGATCDNLVAAEVVTADAQTVRATTEQHPELFWGLHGGGGNFGIVTELVYRLTPVARVLGGLLAYRVEQLAELLRFYRDFMAAAPDELTVELSIVTLSQPVVFAMVCYSGEPEEGERVVQPLRSFGPPVADGLRVLPYPELTERPPISFLWPVLGMSGFITMAARQVRGKPEANFWKGGCLSSLSDAVIERLTRCLVDAPPFWSMGLGHYMHGALCRVPDTTTSMLRKPGSLTYFLSADWRDPPEAKATMAWVERSWTAMQPVSDRGTYINYLSVEGEEAVRESYGAHYERLVSVKQQYDPTNFFHLNRNIPPHP